MKPNDYEFAVGDKVVTVYGEVGTIVDICTCEWCVERGFCEPIWIDDIAGKKNNITIADAGCGFDRFRQIGKYRFNSILRKKAVLLDIEHYERALNRAKEQLAVIEELEKEA